MVHVCVQACMHTYVHRAYKSCTIDTSYSTQLDFLDYVISTKEHQHIMQYRHSRAVLMKAIQLVNSYP